VLGPARRVGPGLLAVEMAGTSCSYSLLQPIRCVLVRGVTKVAIISSNRRAAGSLDSYVRDVTKNQMLPVNSTNMSDSINTNAPHPSLITRTPHSLPPTIPPHPVTHSHISIRCPAHTANSTQHSAYNSTMPRPQTQEEADLELALQLTISENQAAEAASLEAIRHMQLQGQRPSEQELELDIGAVGDGSPDWLERQQKALAELLGGSGGGQRPPAPAPAAAAAAAGGESCTACDADGASEKAQCGHFYCAECLARVGTCCGAPVS